MASGQPNIDDHWIWGLYERGLTLIPLGTAGEEPPEYLIQRKKSLEDAREDWPKTPRERWADWQKFTPSHKEIEQWILKYPGCNFAIVTGKEINVVDADDEAACEFVRENLTRTPWVVKTAKGAHFYYQTSSTLILKNSSEQNAKLDTRGVGGYVVAPGSTHHSGVRYSAELDPAWPVQSVSDLPVLSGEDLQKITQYQGTLTGGVQPMEMGVGTKIQFDASGVAPGWESGVGQGSRDANLVKLIGRWINENLPIGDIYAKAFEVDAKNTPPLGEREVIAKVQSVIGTHGRNNLEEIKKASTPTERDADGAALIRWANTTEYQDPAPLNYVIDDYLVAGTTSMVFGGPGICKSFIVQDMGMSVATGQDWHGREVHRGLVFYVCGEGHQDLPNRIHAWKIEHGYSREDTFPFYHSEHEVNLRDPEMVAALVELIKNDLAGTIARLIVIDTLSTNFGGGDENTGDMTDFINHMNGMARDTGAHVMIVHHTGKDKDKGARGNSSSHGNVYTYMPVDESNGKTRLSMMKQKGGPQMKPLGFDMELIDLGEAKDARGRTKKITSLVPKLTLDANVGEEAAAQLIDREKTKKAGGTLQKSARYAIDRLLKQATNTPPVTDQKTLYEAMKAAGIPDKKTTEYRNYALNEGFIEETEKREILLIGTSGKSNA